MEKVRPLNNKKGFNRTEGNGTRLSFSEYCEKGMPNISGQRTSKSAYSAAEKGSPHFVLGYN